MLYILKFYVAEECLDKNSHKGIIMFWFMQAVSQWENQLPDPAVLTLALNLAVFLLSEEQHFKDLNENKVIERFMKILKEMLDNIGATPDVGYIRLIACCLNHKAGCEWIISSNYWCEVLNLYSNSNKNSNLNTEVIIFMRKLLTESIEIDKNFCDKIICCMLSPTIDFSAVIKNKNDNEEVFCQNCLPRLELLVNVIDSLLDTKQTEKKFDVLKRVVDTSERNQFEKHAVKICQESLSDHIDCILLNLLYTFRSLECLVDYKYTSVIDYSIALPYIMKCENVRKQLVFQYQKNLPIIILHWTKFFSKCRTTFPKIRMYDGTVTNIDEILTFFQFMPLHGANIYLSGETANNFDTNDFREKTLTDNLRKIPPISLYQLFQLRDFIQNHFSFEYSIKCVECLVKSFGFYNRSQAIMASIHLIFAIEDFIEILRKNDDMTVNSVLPLEYLEVLLDAAKRLINEFNLQWKDTFETIVLMEIVLSIFSISRLTSQVSKRVLLFNAQ